jgi:hypothetical protein
MRLFYTLVLATVVALGSACNRPASASGDNTGDDSARTAPSSEETTRPRAESNDSEKAAGCGCTHSDCHCSKQGHRYSPFGVDLTGSHHFDIVSFKDVGLDSAPFDSESMLEIVAQSLAYSLRQHDHLGLSARLLHDERLAEPSEHTFCEARRLYVDVWHSPSPSRWGYSLWSGCSEAFQFAHREVTLEGDHDSLESAVRPLTESIADALADANDHDCFRRRC